MSQTTPLPVKAKKKKRSFFEEDDFFVMKKSKKTKSPTPSKPAPLEKSAPLSDEVAKLSTSDVPDSEDLTFHSARDEHSDVVDEVELVEDGAEEIDGVEDEDTDLNKFFKGISNAHNRSSEEDSENSRKYIIKIISKVGPPQEFEVNCFGNDNFTSILGSLEQDSRQQNWPFYLHLGTLVWVEGRLELKPFFKPSTLRISPPPYLAPTRLTCLYIPIYHLDSFEDFYPEFETKKESAEVVYDVVEVSEAPEQPRTYFIIGLKGKDNKRIEVEVGSDTKIRSLLSFYLTAKGIDESQVKAPRLIFDDEELDLNGVVGDTELEEDFEVQVYM